MKRSNTFISHDFKLEVGDICLVDISDKGYGVSGKRPAVILQNNTGNIFSPNVIVIPLTSVLKKTSQPTHVVIKAYDSGLEMDSMALCENICVISKDNVYSFLTKMPEKYMREIAKAHLLATSDITYLSSDDIKEVIHKAKELNGKEREGICSIVNQGKSILSL